MEFINVDGVSFRYGNENENADLVLDDIRLTIQPGEFVALLGHNGCGKSTLAKHFNAMLLPTGGKVWVDCKDTSEEENKYPVRRLVGMVLQKAVLFKGSLRENMKWGKADASDEEIYQALAIAQARDFVEAKGKGLKLFIEQGGKNLSGGQRQRLTIARALVRKPEILIMDDSASALDFATDARLRKAIREETRDMTVFLVSQRVATVRGADQIIVLDDGKIAGMGTHRQLLDGCQIYREICQSQLSEKEVQ